MKILIVGGAGYIGSHTVREAYRRGWEPVVFDNYSTGNPEAVEQAERVRGDLCNPQEILALFEQESFGAVIHHATIDCAANNTSSHTADSYHNNVAGTLNLLKAMLQTGVERLVLSSTGQVFGQPSEIPIPSSHPAHPISSFAKSVHMVEQMLKDMSQREKLRFISLRFFHAAGADPSGEIGEAHQEKTHLIPALFNVALGQRKRFLLYGGNQSTPDGSCIRDFVHVNDLARAHLQAVECIDRHPNRFVNVGSDEGYSLREVISEVEALVGCKIPTEIGPVREGDVPILVADSEDARKILGWQAEHPELLDILKSAWNWHSQNPHGFGDQTNSNETFSQSAALFGEVAVQLGYVSEIDVQSALQRQSNEQQAGKEHQLIGMHMLQMGLISTSQMIEILKQYEARIE